MKLKVGDIIQVHGYVMLKGLEAGRYKVKKIGNYHGIDTYTFCKPRGTKSLLTFGVGQIDFWISENNPDLNKIVKE